MLICPYCLEPLANERQACCGEYGHAVEVEEEAELEKQNEAAQAAEDEE